MQQQNRRHPRRPAGRPLCLAIGGIAHQTKIVAPPPPTLDDSRRRAGSVTSSVHFGAAPGPLAEKVVSHG